MVQITQRTKKIGGSLMIRIPKDVADIEQIYEGAVVQVEVKKARKEFFGISRGMRPFNKKEDRAGSKYE